MSTVTSVLERIPLVYRLAVTPTPPPMLKNEDTITVTASPGRPHKPITGLKTTPNSFRRPVTSSALIRTKAMTTLGSMLVVATVKPRRAPLTNISNRLKLCLFSATAIDFPSLPNYSCRYRHLYHLQDRRRLPVLFY